MVEDIFIVLFLPKALPKVQFLQVSKGCHPDKKMEPAIKTSPLRDQASVKSFIHSTFIERLLRARHRARRRNTEMHKIQSMP